MFSASPGSLNGSRRPARAAGHDVLTPARVFILPSRVGVVFALVLLAMLLGAINYGNSLAYALTFLLAGMSVVSILHTYRNLRGLEFRAGPSRPVFQGEKAGFPVTVTNPGAGSRYALSLANVDNDEAVFDLGPGKSRQVELRRPTHRRGWLRASRLTVSSRYPLGLFRAWAYLELGQRCLVYPAPAPGPGAPARQGAGSHDGGRAGEGYDDFAGFRRYQPGDSLRQVHWKALARSGQLLTRQYEGETGDQLWLRYDDLAAEAPERRLQLLCRMVLEAARSGERYGLQLPGQRFGPASGEDHQRRCLKALALFGGRTG